MYGAVFIQPEKRRRKLASQFHAPLRSEYIATTRAQGWQRVGAGTNPTLVSR